MNLQLVHRYISSLSKNENLFYAKKKTNQNKAKGQKKERKERIQRRESNPGPPTCRVDALSIAQRQLTLMTFVKLIIFKSFAHEILPVDAV